MATRSPSIIVVLCYTITPGLYRRYLEELKLILSGIHQLEL